MNFRKIHDKIRNYLYKLLYATSDKCIVFIQSFSKYLYQSIFNITHNVHILNIENIENIQKPYVIMMNHKSPRDPFILSFLYKFNSKLLPLRFISSNVIESSKILNFLYKIGIVPIIYLIHGCLIVVRGQGIDNSLKNAKIILRDKRGTVVIFPEGRVDRGEGVGFFKWGISHLVKDLNVNILPVCIDYKKSKNKFKKDLTILVGESFSIPKDLSPTEGAMFCQKIMEKMYNSIK